MHPLTSRLKAATNVQTRTGRTWGCDLKTPDLDCKSCPNKIPGMQLVVLAFLIGPPRRSTKICRNMSKIADGMRSRLQELATCSTIPQFPNASQHMRCITSKFAAAKEGIQSIEIKVIATTHDYG